MPLIVSTLSASNEYVSYHRPDLHGANVGRPAAAIKSVLIKGGANVAGALRTPEGVVTRVSDEELQHLHSIKSFRDHVDGGHLKILNTEKEVDGDQVAKDMKDRDDSAQLDESKGDFKKGGRAGGLAPKNAKVE